MYIKKLLNQKASELIKGCPQNVQKQVDAFIKVAAESVNEYIKEADGKVDAAKAQIKGPSKKTDGEQFFLKKYKCGSSGLFPALFRATLPTKPLSCMNYQEDIGQPKFCSAACAGFRILSPDKVRLCNKEEIDISKE